jgi:hypothetical protein
LRTEYVVNNADEDDNEEIIVGLVIFITPTFNPKVQKLLKYILRIKSQIREQILYEAAKTLHNKNHNITCDSVTLIIRNLFRWTLLHVSSKTTF